MYATCPTYLTFYDFVTLVISLGRGEGKTDHEILFYSPSCHCFLLRLKFYLQYLVLKGAGIAQSV
jgi:hypothetical protein